MSKWDKGVDYSTMYNLIVRHLKKTHLRKHKCYDSILLIQLRNGSRVSEAVRAYMEYLKTKKTEVEVLVSKKKKAEKRLMIIPEVALCEELLLVDERKLVDRVKHYCINTYKINTHSLRYAFITYLLKQGVNPAIISKITKHSKLDFILTYTQEKISEEVLRNM